VRRECASSLPDQLQTATTLGLDKVGLPSSAAPIASLFGGAKHHGVGESKEANRIALRLPALCGAPTPEEAKQVLALSVAEPHDLPGRFTSLIQQRRAVLPNPDALERLSMEHTGIHVDLLPSAKNRSTHQKTVPLSISYKESYGPALHRQAAHRCPERAVA